MFAKILKSGTTQGAAKRKAGTPCYSSGNSMTVSVGERARGYTHCPDCGKKLKVGYNSKTKIIPNHNKEEKA